MSHGNVRLTVFGILFGVSAYEFALFASDGIDARLKSLAQLKTASLVGCPY